MINTEEQYDFDSPPIAIETETSIHPNLVGIDFSLPTDEPPRILCKEDISASLPRTNCDTFLSTDNLELTASSCVDAP